jgi:hypothetical protein
MPTQRWRHHIVPSSVRRLGREDVEYLILDEPESRASGRTSEESIATAISSAHLEALDCFAALGRADEVIE